MTVSIGSRRRPIQIPASRPPVYDANDNILTRQTRAGPTIAYTYDTLNRLSTKAAPSEATVTYRYDLDNRLTGASDNSAAIPSRRSPPGRR